MADSTTAQLVRLGGRHLPVTAWRTAYAVRGAEILKAATFVPEEFAAELLGGDRPVPHQVAVAVAKASHGSALPLLAADRRATVQAALLKNWTLDGASIDAVLEVKPSADTLALLAEAPMDLARRARMWTLMAPDVALGDALRFVDVCDPSHLEPLFAQHLVDQAIPTAAAIIAAHPQLVPFVAEEGSPSAAFAAAWVRAGADHATALMERTPARDWATEETHARMLVAIADHPATPMELRREALAEAGRLGALAHLRMGVFAETVPHVARLEDWDDDAARATVVRAVRSDSLSAWRLWHLLEVIGSYRVSHEVRRVAAHRFHENCLVKAPWAVACAPLDGVMSTLLDRSGYRWWAERVTTENPLLRRPETVAPSEAIGPGDRTGRNADPAAGAELAVNGAPAHRLHDAAAFLAERIDADETRWRLLWELLEGFEGTFSELVSMVNVS